MAVPPRSIAASALACGGLLVALTLGSCRDDPRPSLSDVPVRVDRIAIDHFDSPVVVLEEKGGPRWLPIWIGTAEARSIAMQIERRRSPRPNSHDLTRDLIHSLDGSVERVVVTELRDGTYYAVLGVLQRGRLVEIDARPSDAIAIALRDGAPIFVRDTLFERVSGLEADEEAPPEQEI